MILQYLTDTLDYILSLDSQAALRVFWYFIIFDLPRYLLTDFYVLFRDLLGRLNVQEGSAFLRRLREDPPLVSVVVPVLNEEKTIAWTVKSLREQSYRRLQIIIVDDGSTDATPTICQRLADNKTVYYTRFAERAGKSAVLNHGLRLARGEYVIFVDSDTTFDTDAIFNVIKQFADPAVGGVAGNLMVRNGSRNLLTQLQEIEYIFTISIGRRIRALFGILPIISGAFGAFRRDLISLETMGGHEPGPGNDSDLAIRLRKKGYKIVFAHDAHCATNVPETLLRLIRQRARWDRNLIKNRLRKHRDVFNPFSENFRLRDVVTFVDSIFFHLVLSGVTLLYIADMAIHFPTVLPYLLLINFSLYFCAECAELVIAAILMRNKSILKLALYLPIFNPYKLFIKLVRISAYCQELFLRASYRDPFAPFKVRQKLIRW